MANILLTPERLARIKLLKGTDPYAANLAVADTNLVSPIWFRSTSSALAYQCGEGYKYGLAAKAVVLDFCRTRGTAPWTADDSYYYRSLYVLALILDWTRALWTASEIEEARAYLVPIAFDPIAKQYWAWNNAANNYSNAHQINRCAVGLAFNDSSLVQEAVDWAKKYWVPYANGEGRGGGYWESTNYCGSAVGRSIRIALMLKEAGAYDLFAQTPWFGESVPLRWYASTPWGTNMLIGDQPQAVDGAFRGGDFDWGLSLLECPNAELAQGWLKKYPGLRMYSEEDVWLQALFTNPAVAAAGPTTMALTLELPGPGIRIQRSDWTDKASYDLTECGGLYSGHQMGAQGGYQFGREGWLENYANRFGATGDLVFSGFCNVPLFDGQAQVPTPNYTYPTTGIVRSGPDQWEMQFRDLYAGKAQDATRKVQILAPNLRVVWDRLIPVDLTKSVTEQWHAQKIIQVTPTSGDLDKVRYTILVPNAFSASVDPINQGIDGAKSSERLSITTKDRSIIQVFQLQEADGSFAPLSASLNADGTATVNGVTVQSPGPTAPKPLPPPSSTPPPDPNPNPAPNPTPQPGVTTMLGTISVSPTTLKTGDTLNVRVRTLNDVAATADIPIYVRSSANIFPRLDAKIPVGAKFVDLTIVAGAVSASTQVNVLAGDSGGETGFEPVTVNPSSGPPPPPPVDYKELYDAEVVKNTALASENTVLTSKNASLKSDITILQAKYDGLRQGLVDLLAKFSA